MHYTEKQVLVLRYSSQSDRSDQTDQTDQMDQSEKILRIKLAPIENYCKRNLQLLHKVTKTKQAGMNRREMTRGLLSVDSSFEAIL